LKTKSFETQTDIDFTNFSKGIYFIKIITETNVVNKKIIIY